jgi:hypothetical protein
MLILNSFQNNIGGVSPSSNNGALTGLLFEPLFLDAIVLYERLEQIQQ